MNMAIRHLITAAFVAGTFVFSAGALAAELHPVLKQLKDEKGAKIEFIGHDSGLDGWLVTAKNDAGADVIQYAYTNKEGGLVLGILFGPDGNATTVDQLARYRNKIKGGKAGASASAASRTDKSDKADMAKVDAPVPPPAPVPDAGDAAALDKEMPLPELPDFAPEALPDADAGVNVSVNASADVASPSAGGGKAEQFYALTEKANWVQVGSRDAPHMYVFINPTCEHCIAYWKALRMSVDNGTLALRLVPFGALEQNRKLGAALLGSPDPAKAWRDFVEGKLSAMPLSLATPDTLKKIDDNTALWGKMGLTQAPPFSLYRAPADGKIRAVIGKPDNVMMLIADFVD